MLYINELRPGDIIIPDQMKRFINANRYAAIDENTDAYTLVILDEEYLYKNNGVTSFLYSSCGCLPGYRCIDEPYQLQFPWDEYPCDYYEHVNAEYIVETGVNIGCVGCTECVGCFDCKDCINCKNCFACYRCIGCNNCRDCEKCKKCTYCENLCKCKKCEFCHENKTGYQNIEDDHFKWVAPNYTYNSDSE